MSARDGAAIGPGEVHLWWLDLTRPLSTGEDLAAAVLDPDERERASRFRLADDRLRFIAARSALRRLAGEYLGERPEALRFETGPKGKPYLPGASLRFSVSKTREAVMLGFAQRREIGVDVERVRTADGGADVAERFFAPEEVEALEALPGGAKPEAFFRCWTAKEAYLKARGEGLAFPLGRFAVPIDGAATPRRLRWHSDPDEQRRWWIIPLTPDEGYVAAVAIEGELPNVRFRTIES